MPGLNGLVAELADSDLSERFGKVPPFDVEVEYPTEIAGVPMQSYTQWMASCAWVSLLGSPAISVPAGRTPEGLPVGLQIVGPPKDDLGVLQLANAIERASPTWRAPSSGSQVG